ncbi:MAG: MazG family protein [Acidimicrobiaceae bacterium]|nr:MazG family protein [Acidimicrobiia bacterium]MCY4494777.1 MazG family protein [Acidimicrobiaceae bacterium]
MTGTITVVGLGPADETLLTTQTRTAAETAPRCFLRTRRHPAARAMPDAVAFDDEYERGDTYEAVYEAIVERLILEAAKGDLLYAVPGSPLVLERTVELLRQAAAAGRVRVEILAAMSFLDLAWSRLGVDPVSVGARLIDGLDFASAAAGQTGPLLVAHCHGRSVLSEIKLSAEEGPDTVVVLARLGLPDETVYEVAWDELDRRVEADHLTSLWIPELDKPIAAEFLRFEELVRELRQRCPWDRVQTHGSLRKHLLEETYETLEVLDARALLDDGEVDAQLDADLVEELGDLLYQIFFHARLGAERGSFTVADVARSVHDKLVTRHPHVFGEGARDGVRGPEDADDMARSWEQIKRAEKGRASAMDGVPMTLPALMLAAKVQDRAASAGLGAENTGAVVEELAERLARVAEQQTGDGMGDLLFDVVALARCIDIDPETALRTASMRFMEKMR